MTDCKVDKVEKTEIRHISHLIMAGLALIFLMSGIILLTSAGCREQRVIVSGIITFQGAPLEHFVVTFEPRNYSAPDKDLFYGKTNAKGEFTLQKPCEPGPYTVRINWKDPNPPDISKYPDGPTSNVPEIELPQNASDGTIVYIVPQGKPVQARFDL